MPLTIAIYGPSGCGKTSVSTRLAAYFKDVIQVRHCGELLKARAKELSQSAQQIAANEMENNKLDESTRTFVLQNDKIAIVEGRFLKTVLENINQVLLVELTCSKETLESRISHRDDASGVAPPTDLVESFECDSVLNQLQSLGTNGMQIALETDALPIDSVARIIYCYAIGKI